MFWGIVISKKVKGEKRPKFEINTSNFADGTYLVKVYTDDNVTLSDTQKIIIMKNK